MTAKKKYIVKILGSLDEANSVIKFAYKLPSYCKTLNGISLFSPAMIRQASSQINAELSLWINNKKSPVGNYLFTLGYPAIDEQQCRMLDINQSLMKGHEITGYVKCLGGDRAFEIHLILECKM